MQDYYEVLGLTENCTDDEIRNAYKRKALKWHPDRNYGKEEVATLEFAQAQTAYEILSDPNDRAWYDRTRSITPTSHVSDARNDTMSSFSAAYLARLSHKVLHSPLTDTKTGFFAETEKLFELILAEENLENCDSDQKPNYPSFGNSKTSEIDVRAFYAAWKSFNSQRNFAWADRYYTHDLSNDRKERRFACRANIKSRNLAKSEFNEAVQSLLSMVQKRDPRHVVRVVSDARRLQELRKSRMAQAEAARVAHQSSLGSFEAQAWQEPSQVELEDVEPTLDEHVNTHIQCVACNKMFKTEKTFEAHARSRKHIQTVNKLEWARKQKMGSGRIREESPSAEESVSNDRLRQS